MRSGRNGSLRYSKKAFQNNTGSIKTTASTVSSNSTQNSLQKQPRKTSNSLRTKLKRKSAVPQTPSTLSTFVPELPPLQVPEHYKDLTDLFDFSLHPLEEHHPAPEQPQATIEERATPPMDGLGIRIVAPPQVPAKELPTLHALTTTDLDQPNYDYEYYNYEYRDDSSSIQLSTDVTPNQPAQLPRGPPAEQSQLSHGTIDSLQSPASPSSLQNSTSSLATSLSHRSKPANMPVEKPAESRRLSSRVRSMFSSSKTNRSSLAHLDNLNFSKDSGFSFVQNDALSTQPMTCANKDDSLSFTNKKPTPHFSVIDTGPRYKAHVVPVRNNSKRSLSSSISPSSPQTRLDSIQRHSAVNETASIPIHDRSETLDFVPNLRPTIDNVGSRLRAFGVPSPANIMMTKSQYEKYLLTAKKQKTDDKDEDEDEDEDADNSDNDDSDDESALRDRRIFAAEEAKQQDFRMRMRQDAHLSVYRQKMTKLTGSQIGMSTLSNNPSNRHTSLPSFDNMDIDPDDSEEDYDDVPLGILKAHGFPNSGRAKIASSQPNLVRSNSDDAPFRAPGLIYSTSQDPSRDSMSVRSFQSAGAVPRSVTPAIPEEGYLAMRNQSNINIPGFNSSVPMNRGLVGEIAKEEDAKTRRKSVMNILSTQRTPTLNGASDSDSINEDQHPSEIQTQLQQMMYMQSQILHQMSTTQMPQIPQIPGGGASSIMLQPRKTWSSFDMMHQQLPTSRSGGGAMSIRSGNGSGSGSDHSGGVYVAGGGYAQNVHKRFSRPGHMSHNSFGSVNDEKALQTRQSMRLVGDEGEQENEEDEDEEDEDEEEAGWKELEERRKQLRQMWKSQQQPTAMVS